MSEQSVRPSSAPPTLERLVSGSAPLVRVLAGRMDGRRVDRVGLLLNGEHPDDSPATVWFCAETPESTPLDVLVLQMFRSESAGLVLPELSLPESVHLLADHLDFPVLGVSRCDFSQVIENWWMRVGLNTLQSLDETYSCQQSLLHLAIEADEVTAYLIEAGRILDADVALIDDAPQSTPGEDLVEIPWGLGRGSHLKIRWHDREVAERKAAADTLLTLVSLLLDRDVASIESELRLRGELLLELLVDGTAPTGSVVRAAERFGLDLGMEHVVAVWDLEDFTFLARRPDLTEARILRLKRDISCAIETHVRTGVGKVWVLPHLDSFVVVMEPSSGVQPPEVLGLLSRVQAGLRPVLRRYRLKEISVGVGFSYSGAAGLRKSFEEAQESLLIGRSNFGEGSVTHFRDLGLHRFLFGWYNSPRSRALAEEFLAPLLKETPAEREKLFATLRAYLEARGRQSVAAKALGIHRNSLRYRLERITELLRLDLDASSVQLVLQLALRLIPRGD